MPSCGPLMATYQPIFTSCLLFVLQIYILDNNQQVVVVIDDELDKVIKLEDEIVE